MTRPFHHSFTWLLVALTDFFCFVLVFFFVFLFFLPQLQKWLVYRDYVVIWLLLTHSSRLALCILSSPNMSSIYFSSHYHWWITHWGHGNVGNDHQLNVKCIENSMKNMHTDVRVTCKVNCNWALKYVRQGATFWWINCFFCKQCMYTFAMWVARLTHFEKDLNRRDAMHSFAVY